MSNDSFGELKSNPYAATSALETHAPTPSREHYGGIGRLAYFGYTFLAGIVYQVVVFVVVAPMGDAAVVAVLPALLIYFGVLAWIVAYRMINMGYSPWWFLGMFVPFLNILVSVRAIACPEGYADHKTLDTAGKIIVGLFLGSFVLVILLVAML